MHHQTLYACGHVYAECRCPSRDKLVTRMANACPNCVGSPTFAAPDRIRPGDVTAPGDLDLRDRRLVGRD
jgi:hypothetical protein